MAKRYESIGNYLKRKKEAITPEQLKRLKRAAKWAKARNKE